MSWFSECHKKKVPESRSECKPCNLTCLERPKYFCGQLLTEEDLNAEQRYQIEKNRLHNRYLHGWGVVCGLKVTCHPKCSSRGNVLIEKGYAIDSCGRDIILCREEEFNIIEKINECQPKPEEDECAAGAAPKKKDECKDLEKYCLIVKYKEEESRPITALKKDDNGCSVKRCEPSRIKEGYDFEVKKCKDCYESDKKTWKDIFKVIWKNSAWGKMDECESILLDELFGKNVRIDPENHNVLFHIYCQTKEYIKSIAKENINMDYSDISTKLDKIEFPSSMAKNYEDKVKDVYRKLGSFLFQMALDCSCLHFLYPCPEYTKDDKVVLACITVQGDKIKDIYNLSRHQVITFPKLFYWLSIVEKIDEEAVKGLVREINKIKADVTNMKSTMKRDLGSTLKFKANIDIAYQPLAIKLVKGLTENMPPEDLKDVGDKRGEELKKAGIKSVREVLEAVPADISDAIKEPITNATKYVDNAEDLTMKVTIDVYNELKKANIKEKKDLNKLDTKALAKKLKLSERTVKKVISDISRVE